LIIDSEDTGIEKKVQELWVNIVFLDKNKRNETTFNWCPETTTIHMRRFLKSALKGKDKGGKKVNLNKYLKNSQVVSINWDEQEESLDLVSYLYREGEEKYIGYLKPAREDLATLVIVVTEVDTRLQVIGFCVDDPYDDDQDRVNISRIFHSVLVGSIDYHTMETSQDYSVITTDITEDYQVSNQELTNNGDETTMMVETESCYRIDESTKKQKFLKVNVQRLRIYYRPQKENHQKGDNLMDNNYHDDTICLLDTSNSKSTHNLKTHKQLDTKQKHACPHCSYRTTIRSHLTRHIQSVHDGIKFPCPHCDYKATAKDSLKEHIKSVHDGIKYPCPHCSYQITHKADLRRHIQSIHDGIKYPCHHCSYHATQKADLRKHIQSVHDGIKYPCPHCDYRATTKGSLKRHIQRKHVSI